jgi:hypothetical protein
MPSVEDVPTLVRVRANVPQPPAGMLTLVPLSPLPVDVFGTNVSVTVVSLQTRA